MNALVDKLVEKKSLTKQEFFNLVELHGCLEPTPPSILDIRAAQRHNIMTNAVEATHEIVSP